MPTIIRRAPYRIARRRWLPSAPAAGPVVVTPAASTLRLLTADPVVATGDVTVAPTATQLTLSVVNPTAIAGSLSLAPAATQLTLSAPTPTVLPNALVGLRFFGTDTSTYPDVDRLRIPLRDGATPTAADVGAGDFTYELWLRCAYADNTSSSIADVRYSNIVLDRDIWNDARGHVLGVTRRTGPILAACFGVAGAGLTWTTIYGTTDIGDDQWHHLAVVRRQSTGVIELWVDGALDASGTYTTGDLSYNGGNTGGQDNNQIVIGTEKHDVGVGFNGDIDVIRISDIRRYTAAFKPERPLAVDSDVAVMYRLNEAIGTSAADASGNGITATLAVGGPNSAPQWFVESGLGTLISPAATQLALSIVNPTVAIGAVTVTPAATAVTLATVDPGVVAGSLSLAPAAELLRLLSADPTVIAGSLSIGPAAVTLILSVVDPTVQAGGDTSVTPAATVMRLLSADPGVVLGALTIAPAAEVLRFLTADPGVVAGSLIIGPAATVVTFAAIDPAIVAGSVSVGPAATLLRLLHADPTLILSSMSVTPAAVVLRLLAADPSVLIGSAIVAHAARIYRAPAEPTIYRAPPESTIYRPEDA